MTHTYPKPLADARFIPSAFLIVAGCAMLLIASLKGSLSMPAAFNWLLLAVMGGVVFACRSKVVSALVIAVCVLAWCLIPQPDPETNDKEGNPLR